MRCILCRLQLRSGHTGAMFRPASYVVFGLGVCAIHADRLAGELIAGASVRDVLRQAEAGEWG